MTVTVKGPNGNDIYDQPDLTFGSDDDGGLVISTGTDVIALYSVGSWWQAITDIFDSNSAANPPVSEVPAQTEVNPAPPEPTPHAEPVTAPVTTPETPEVPDGTTVVPLTDTGASSEITPETPLTPVSTPSSTSGTYGTTQA